MEQSKFDSIGLEISQVVFNETPYCTVWGKAFVENGYYHADIVMTLQDLYVLIKHNPQPGKMLQYAIAQEFIGRTPSYPLQLDLQAYYKQPLLFNADKIILKKIRTRHRKENGAIHYALQVEQVLKLNKLTVIANTRVIARLTHIPEQRIIRDEPQLDKAYQLYNAYVSLDINEEVARQHSGLSHPALFSLAYISSISA